MILKLKRTPGIYLVGFMGCGKSTVGRELAQKLGWRFADVDDDIERDENMTIAEIFEQRGEPEFRRIEHEAIAHRVRRVRSGSPHVLALGGGAFAQAHNIELLNSNGVTIWIDTALPIVRRRVAMATHRPLARDPKKLEQLFNARRGFYTQADYRVAVVEDNSRLAVQAILDLPIFR